MCSESAIKKALSKLGQSEAVHQVKGVIRIEE
jgi:hypothetical protein